MAVRSDFSGDAMTSFGSGFDFTCESSLSDDPADFVGVEVPGANKEGIEPFHASKPPDEGLMGEGDDVVVPNKV